MAFFFPEEAEVRSFEKIVADSVNWKLRLFKNDQAGGQEIALGALTEADFPGYAEVAPPVQDGDVETDGNGKARQTFENAQFTLDAGNPGPYPIYGCYIVDEDDLLLCYERFADAPRNLTDTSPILLLTPFLTLNTE